MNETDASLATLAAAALNGANFDEFWKELRLQEFPNSFGVLVSGDVGRALRREEPNRSLAEWITRRPTWDVASYSAVARLSPSETLLHHLWSDLEGRLRKKLEAAARRVPLAPSGAIICFFGGAALSVIVSYRRTIEGVFELKPIAIEEEPRGVFEIEHLLARASPEQRNAIKASALSVDKIIFQRGVLTHVDRQRDDVFGPSIDTIVLAEILSNYLQMGRATRELAALEIGPGSGHLCATLASAGVGRIYAIDLSASAVVCTLKNLQINEFNVEAKQPEISVRAERFRAEEMAKPVDLIICNPPYLPEDDADPDADESAYDLAVRGLELSGSLLDALDSLLTPHGQLLLMASSISADEVIARIPNGFAATPVLPGAGFRVPLDVDTLWQRAGWRQALVEADRIKKDAGGNLWHHVRPLWIRRKAEA
jgi:tRNA1(Val) A37 N6-methylase TrmN6